MVRSMTPRFLAAEFLRLNQQVIVDGQADPDCQIQLYRVEETRGNYGTLSQPLATTTSNAQGQFSFTLTQVPAGMRLSAIATDPKYGTSEPSPTVVVRSLPHATDPSQRP